MRVTPYAGWPAREVPGWPAALLERDGGFPWPWRCSTILPDGRHLTTVGASRERAARNLARTARRALAHAPLRIEVPE